MMSTYYDHHTIPVHRGATKDDRVWVVDRFHNRITNRKIGRDIIRCGHFPSCTVSVTATKEEAVAAMLAHRAAVLDDARKYLAGAERAMESALAIAARDGAPQ